MRLFQTTKTEETETKKELSIFIALFHSRASWVMAFTLWRATRLWRQTHMDPSTLAAYSHVSYLKSKEISYKNLSLTLTILTTHQQY